MLAANMAFAVEESNETAAKPSTFLIRFAFSVASVQKIDRCHIV